MQQSAIEPADASDRQVCECRIGPGQERNRQNGAEQSAHTAALRKATPASAIAPPAARTARRPAGQRASRPKLMPARCKSPVATTKPTEKATTLAPGGSS